jgi:Ca2+-transporting ATPase
MIANLFLVHVNSSDNDFAIHSAGRLVKDWVMWAVTIGTFGMLIIIIYSPISILLKLAPLSAAQAFTSLGLAAASVLWYEVVKLVKKFVKKGGNKNIESA